jgi:DNA-binding transcriptional LysR family regulator
VIRLTPHFSADQVDTVLWAAGAGYGIAAALSYQVGDALGAGSLVRVLQPYEVPPLPVHLLVPSKRHMPARVRAFLDQAADNLTQLQILRVA